MLSECADAENMKSLQETVKESFAKTFWSGRFDALKFCCIQRQCVHEGAD